MSRTKTLGTYSGHRQGHTAPTRPRPSHHFAKPCQNLIIPRGTGRNTPPVPCRRSVLSRDPFNLSHPLQGCWTLLGSRFEIIRSTSANTSRSLISCAPTGGWLFLAICSASAYSIRFLANLSRSDMQPTSEKHQHVGFRIRHDSAT